MKLAIFADVHANYTALQAVLAEIAAWQPERVIVAGDIVNRGPQPLQCWQLLQGMADSAGWFLMRGNHEDYVIDVAAHPKSGYEREFLQPVVWTAAALGQQVAALAALPEGISLHAPNGSELRVRHASMRHNREGLYPENDDAMLAMRFAPAPAVFVTGHTHRAFIRQVNGTLVVNVGSAGLPFDGDTRPTYAQITWGARHGWQANIQRVNYDHAAAQRAFEETGFAHEGGALTRVMLRELQQARSLLYGWTSMYQDSVLSGTISMEESVRLYLEQQS
ncbi:MAG: metallophosphoesterase family protein [Anaerolineales bacterium]